MNRFTTSLMTAGVAASVVLTGPGIATAEAAPQRVEILAENPSNSIGEQAVKNQVNLGDSQAGGFGGGINPYEPTDMSRYTPNTIIDDVNECHRLKLDGYATLVAVGMGNTLDDVACAGATTADMFKSQWAGNSPDTYQPPQIERVTPDTRLVTIQIGANDADFAKLVEKVVGDPLNPQDPNNQLTAESAEYVEAIRVLEEELPQDLDKTYNAIEERAADDVTVVVNSYDDILPESTTLPNGMPDLLNLCSPYMTEEELGLSRTFLQKLNDVTRSAAERAGKKFKFVEPKEWFRVRDAVGLPEDACHPSADAKAWSLRFKDVDPNSTNFSFHGTKSWHWSRAKAILQMLGR